MKQLKFRWMDIMWNWYYWLVSNPKHKSICRDEWYFICNSAWAPFAYQIRPETLWQFTWLYDLFKNPIYEGDIAIDIEWNEWIVEYWEEQWRFILKFKNDKMERLWEFNWVSLIERVLGNVYENPALMEW